MKLPRLEIPGVAKREAKKGLRKRKSLPKSKKFGLSAKEARYRSYGWVGTLGGSFMSATSICTKKAAYLGKIRVRRHRR